MLEPQTYCDLIDQECATIVALATTDTLRLGIPHCDGWPVDDMIRHLGDVHRWATSLVLGQTSSDDDYAHITDDPLVDWFREGAASLVKVLASVSPTQACWTFDFPPGEAWFWMRRQALETAVHRVDVEVACGLDEPVDRELCIEGLIEVVDLHQRRQVALGRMPELPGTITFKPTDYDHDFIVGDLSQTAAATISGTANDLLRMIWGRPHNDVTRSGDSGLLAALEASAIVP